MRHDDDASGRDFGHGGNTARPRVVGTPMIMAEAAWARLSRSAILAILLAAGCVACAGPAASLAPSPDPQLRAAATRDGIRVTLALEGPPLSSVASWANLRIENGGPGIVRWAGGGCGDPGGISIDLHEAFPPGKEWPGVLGRFKTVALGIAVPDVGNPASTGYVEASRFGDAAVACPAVLSIERLLPGASLAMRAAWDGRMQGAAAPTGPATVSGVFPYIGREGAVAMDRTDIDAIPVSIETTVVGPADGAAVLSPALAVDAALADPQFAAWVQAAPEATWINPELSVIEGLWYVGLFRTEAQNDLYGGVMVDQSGTIVGRRFGP